MKPAIVVVAYNRDDALERILKSLDSAVYEDNNIELVISIDYSQNKKVRKAAEDFHWRFGEKRIVVHADRMGLKKHIIECGGYAKEYGSIIMLEDDLYVSPDFYNFASKALEFSSKYPEIGGVSLYSHRFNVFARLPFEPVNDGFDNWYFQFASSWGQAWTAEQWTGFSEWLEVNDGKDISGNGLPSNVAEWGESSWLKYAIKYLIEKDKYFLYPRVSYTTNFADAGEHASHAVTDLQVPLEFGHRENFNFSRVGEARAVYDAYFENTLLPYESDLYGIKYRDGQVRMRYLLSTDNLPFQLVQSYGLLLKPMDANIFEKMEGREIKVYDLSLKAKEAKADKGLRENYFYPGMNRKKIIDLVSYRLRKR